MNVFDNEAPIADQQTAELCRLYAESGLTLDQTRALASFTGRVN